MPVPKDYAYNTYITTWFKHHFGHKCAQKCEHETCPKTFPLYNAPSENNGIRCDNHRLPTDVNVVAPQCMGCARVMYRAERYCKDCRSVKFSLYNHVNAGVKEKTVLEFLGTHFEKLLTGSGFDKVTCDTPFSNKVARRPDLYIPFPEKDFDVIVEVDEELHESYDPKDEFDRYKKFEGLRVSTGRKIIFLRFNVDCYVDSTGTYVESPWTNELPFKKVRDIELGRWNARLDKLANVLQYWVDQPRAPTTDKVTIVQFLYYNGHSDDADRIDFGISYLGDFVDQYEAMHCSIQQMSSNTLASFVQTRNFLTRHCEPTCSECEQPFPMFNVQAAGMKGAHCSEHKHEGEVNVVLRCQSCKIPCVSPLLKENDINHIFIPSVETEYSKLISVLKSTTLPQHCKTFVDRLGTRAKYEAAVNNSVTKIMTIVHGGRRRVVEYNSEDGPPFNDLIRVTPSRKHEYAFVYKDGEFGILLYWLTNEDVELSEEKKKVEDYSEVQDDESLEPDKKKQRNNTCVKGLSKDDDRPLQILE